MSNPVIRYTSRTYNTIMTDINSNPDLVDKPDWFKRIVAGVGDVLAQYINAQANNSYLRTSFTRRSAVDLLSLIDYQLGNRTASSGTLTFYIDRTKTFPITFAQSDLIAQTKGSLSQSSLPFIATAGKVVSAFSETVTADVGSNVLNVAKVYVTGDLVRISSSGVLPSPIQANTDYYVIYVSNTTIKLCSSLADAFNGTPIILSTAGSGTHTATLWSFQASASQLKYSGSTSVGTADSSDWQMFNLADSDIIDSTVVVTVSGVGGWILVDSFINSISTDKHFIIRYDSDGSAKIGFGNGVMGAKPTGDVSCSYATGGGSVSNVTLLNRIVIYSGGNSSINGVTNTTVFNGGGDFESIENAKIYAPMLLKSRDRFVTTEDGASLTLNYGGITKCKINKNVYGSLSCQVVIVPTGGGLPSSGLKSSLQTYLISKSILESMDVRVTDPTYITVNVTSAMSILSGYVWTSVLPYFTLACRLFLTEIGTEIQNKYISSGIASAVTMINSKWSTSFAVGDYDQISKMLSLDYLTPADFGVTVQDSRFKAYIQEVVEGCNYITVTVPTFPVTINVSEITTDGVMTLTQIP